MLETVDFILDLSELVLEVLAVGRTKSGPDSKANLLWSTAWLEEASEDGRPDPGAACDGFDALLFGVIGAPC